jgi:uncharacterized membrane protein YfcA
MLEPQVGLFAVLALLAAYVQTVSGFALGLIVMGAVGAFELAPIAFTALVVSLMSLVNVVSALWGRWHDVDRPTLGAAAAAMVPAVLGGLTLLDWLQATWLEGLRGLLGGFILAAGLLLMLRPHPRLARSPRWKAGLWGGIAGLFGGLFSAAGPPIVFHLYREPVGIPVIRATLLAFFLAATLVRIAATGATGALDAAVLAWAAVGVPAVLAGTWLGRRFPPHLPDLAMRRIAFVLLAGLGLALLLS